MKRVTKTRAKQLYRSNREVFAINPDDNTERVIQSESDFEKWEFFGVEISNKAQAAKPQKHENWRRKTVSTA